MTSRESDRPPRVLLLDDDERILSLRGAMLQQRGCEVDEVSNLGDALDALEGSPGFDLIVVDINLGGGPDDRSGIELARVVRSKYGDVPIVAYSATFSERELTDEERGQFERTFARGTAGVEDLAEITDWMVELARDRRRVDAE
jgi:CheY-like chemotaxis protein